jgi:hypothetical protein
VECFDPSFIPAIRRLEVAMRTECIARFNDHQMTVDPVLAAFDRAIAVEDDRAGQRQEGSMNPIVKRYRSALSGPLDQCSNLEVIPDRC